jgi:hypothetical protein
VQIDPSPVTMNETFQLTLTQSGTQAAGVPDLTVLQKDFLILGTARQISYSVINGQSSMNSQWVVTLKPTKTGVLSIPPIKIGSEHSSPMTINIEASTNKQAVAPDNQKETNLGDQSLVLKTSVDQSKPFVNQEIILTVKLYNSKRLLDAEYQAPQADDALILPLGDAKRYQTEQNGTNYVVEEQQYAVFPQKSGVLKIKSPTFTALVYDFNPQRVKAQDKEIEVNVQPIPKQFEAKTWLPAKEVRISEEYENTNQTLSQGSTLVRTISLEGIGIPAQLLPDLSFTSSNEFNVYPEKGTDRNQVRQGELVGSTEFKVTYLFNKTGRIVLPEVKVHWFNTQTGKEETASLAPRSVEITPSAQTQKNIPSSNKQSTVVDKEEEPISRAIPESVTIPDNNYWPWVLALFFACAWIGTLVLWALKKSRRNLKSRDKHALDQLKKACTSSRPKEARDALIKWASLHWPDASILNLSELSHIVHDARLKKQISLLSQALYKNEAQSMWRGDELLRAVHALKSSQFADDQKTIVLPPINPL